VTIGQHDVADNKKQKASSEVALKLSQSMQEQSKEEINDQPDG